MTFIINIIFFLIGKFILKIIVKLFKWATEIFFGEMQEYKEVRLAIIFGASLGWCIILLGFFFPVTLRLLLSRIPEEIVRDYIVAWVMGVGLILIPPFVGYLIKEINVKVQKRSDTIKYILQGYKYCVIFGFSFFVMIIFTPIITAKRSIHRERYTHIPIKLDDISMEKMYELVIDILEPKWDFELSQESDMLRFPRKILKTVDRELFIEEIKERKMLIGNSGKIYINSMDITIEGKKDEINRIRICLEEGLAFNNVNMTWSEIGNSLEDEAYDTYEEFQNSLIDHIEAVKRYEQIELEVKRLSIDYFETTRILFNIYLYEKKMLTKLN